MKKSDLKVYIDGKKTKKFHLSKDKKSIVFDDLVQQALPLSVKTEGKGQNKQ